MKGRSLNGLSIILFLIVVFLQYRMWFEPNGIGDMRNIKKQLELQIQENDRLKKRNDDLLAQVQHLQKNEEAIESKARNELGMIKKGETFYQVVE